MNRTTKLDVVHPCYNPHEGWEKELLHYYKIFVSQLPSQVEVKLYLVVSSEEALELTIGTAAAESGKEALLAIDKAIADAHNLDALVTAPIDKSTVAPHSSNFTGHTGYLADALGARSHAMILACEDLRVALVTEHVPITQLSKYLTQEKIEQKIEVVYDALRNDFNVLKPRIAVLGLNPHAGDGGVIGKEDDTLLKPVIKKL